MVVEDHEEFLKTLFWGEELEVGFRGRRYLIQGHTKASVPESRWRTWRSSRSRAATSFGRRTLRP